MKRSLLFFTAFLSACNGGLDPTLNSPSVERIGITNPDPLPTPTPDPSMKNRIFVSAAVVKGNNFKNRFEKICEQEAKIAKIPGKFTALVADTKNVFGSKYPVNGSIYQMVDGKEIWVAHSYADLIAGKNEAIYASARQQSVDTSVYNFAWTGQKNFSEAALPEYNCNDWTATHTGYGIAGRIGQSGSDALGVEYQECYLVGHLYCIEYNPLAAKVSR